LKKIIFINSHPIQYFAPLYKYLNQQGINTSCWYCSTETLAGHRDLQFNAEVKWDIPVLEGYTHRFFKNYSWKPSFYNGFFGLINPGLLTALLRQPPSVIIVHGWACLTNVLVLILGRLAGHTVCLRAETPLNQELLKGRLNQWLKRFLLRGILFRFVNWFLYIGKQNRLFYEHLGLKREKLLFTPYAVDNERFQNAARKYTSHKAELRQELGFPEYAQLVLFTGKYIQKKRPLDILAAFEKLSLPEKCLVMVGEGEQRVQMEDFIKSQELKDVYLTGFVNQTEIEKYYAVADVFVMCSEEGETWGLSVNEAMNFSLPIVVSDRTGCSVDLVEDGKNGFVFKTGDVNDLSTKIKQAFQLEGHKSHEVIQRYSFEFIGKTLRKLSENS
jgi:glycosyltransferase involved in cell wall biosynthesis